MLLRFWPYIAIAVLAALLAVATAVAQSQYKAKVEEHAKAVAFAGQVKAIGEQAQKDKAILEANQTKISHELAGEYDAKVKVVNANWTAELNRLRRVTSLNPSGSPPSKVSVTACNDSGSNTRVADAVSAYVTEANRFREGIARLLASAESLNAEVVAWRAWYDQQAALH